MKQRLYAIVVAGLARDNLVFSIGTDLLLRPYSQEVYQRKSDADAALKASVAKQIEARTEYCVSNGADPADALLEARRHWRGVWKVATFERVS